MIAIVETVLAVMILIGWGLNYYLARELRKLADALLEIVRDRAA